MAVAKKVVCRLVFPPHTRAVPNLLPIGVWPPPLIGRRNPAVYRRADVAFRWPTHRDERRERV
eukprot:COSAG06_NODE_33937_length_482_cov_0.796345_1_plen_62_part_10